MTQHHAHLAGTQPQPVLDRCQPGVGGQPQAVSSEDLLRGQKAVCIKHNGELYRLQSTRAGKLILTK